MSSVNDVLNMPQNELLRRGSVTKKLLVDALVATRQQLIARDSPRGEQEATSATTLERVLDSKLSPFLNLLSELKSKVDSLSADFARLKQDCSELKTSRGENAEDLCQEALQRLQRREFLVVSGLQENSSGSLEERKQADTESVKTLATFIGLESFEPAEVLRIGKVNPARPRLLRVKCPSVRERTELLRGSKRLHNNPSFRNVYVNPDLTRQQREHNAELRREVRRRRENGEDVIIHRGVVVERSSVTSAAESNFH